MAVAHLHFSTIRIAGCRSHCFYFFCVLSNGELKFRTSAARRFGVYGFFWLLNAFDAALTDRMTISHKKNSLYEWKRSNF